jgi:1-acyl-sn-glycerol-3-phosphate acyltransferase
LQLKTSQHQNFTPISALKKILLYPLTVIFYISFSLVLLFFHPLQWLCFKLGGPNAHKIAVDYLNLFLMGCLYIIGNRCVYHKGPELPVDKPMIIISNHQSMFDIIAIGWFMRKYAPKFISKIELGKGWPSISFNLRNGGNLLIDRSNPRQSLPALTKFGKHLATTNGTAVIFPEGTRSKTGALKKFSTTGLKVLLKNMPDAILVPVTVNNSWKLLKYGFFPVNSGVKLSVTVHKPIPVTPGNHDELLAQAEERVRQGLNNR